MLKRLAFLWAMNVFLIVINKTSKSASIADPLDADKANANERQIELIETGTYSCHESYISVLILKCRRERFTMLVGSS